MDDVSLNVTEARKSLFDLFESVTSHPGERVVIGHRTSPKQALLVSKEYVERLESLVERQSATSFRLVGSAVLHTNEGDPLREVRELANTAQNLKWSAVFGEAGRSKRNRK